MIERLALFSMPFMVKASLSLIAASTMLSLLGVVVVVLNLSALRFALMHMGLLGATAGMVAGISPLAGGMTSITVGSLLFGPLAKRVKLDLSIVTALFMTGSLAVSFLLLYKAGVPAMDAFSIFTGSILMLSTADVLTSFALGLCVVCVFVAFYWEINLVLYDPELAAALGVKADLVYYSLLVMLGLSIGIAMRLVGALMVDAILVLPAMAALPRARSLKHALVLTSVYGGITSVLGLLAAVTWDLPISATVAATGVAVVIVQRSTRLTRGVTRPL